MKKTIRRLLGLQTAPRNPSGTSPASRGSEGRDGQHTIEDNSDNGTRRQLVQVLLRDGLRQHGIPAGWVDCQMLLVTSRSRGPGMYVRLVMRHWDQRLLNYSYAFQKDLMEAITRFEPQASTWLHGISWEFNVGESCPYPEMPDAAVWRDTPVAATPAVSPVAAVALVAPLPDAAADASSAAANADDEVLRDLKDLQNMFAARDASMEEKANAGDQPDFLPTQPSGLS